MLPLDQDTLETLNGASPDWLRSRRRQGQEMFEKLDMPSSKEEVWRYVDLDFDLRDLELVAEPGPAMEASPALAAFQETAARATIVDGLVVDLEGDLLDAFRGLEDGSVDEIADLIPGDLDIFAAAHRAFLRDGVVVRVPKGRTIRQPIVVDVQAVTQGGVSFPHVSVFLEENAEASVTVLYRSPQDRYMVAVPQVEAVVGPGSRLGLVTVQDWGYETRGIAQERVRAGRDSAVRIGEAGLGSRLGRLHLTVDLEGQGANAEVVGLYFGELEQLLDYRLFIHHQSPNTNSDVFLKGAVQDRSHSVFTGLIKIHKDAQRTNAFETNRNLVLSEGAGAESVPNLEILANDVRCGHGSTVGPIDEEQRYYLMTRGLSRYRADRLIVRGFFEEVLQQLPVGLLADPLRLEVNEKFVSAQREGRL